MTQTPSGWHADPWGGPGDRRYWDGQQWTGHVAPAAAASAGPMYPAPAPMAQNRGQLANWWPRVGGYVVDSIVTGIAGWIVGFPFAITYVHRISTMNVELNNELQSGQPVDFGKVYGPLFGPLLGLLAVSLVVILVYQVGMLTWRGATLGKLAAGLEVRRVDGSKLTFGRALARVVFQFGVGGVIPLFTFVDDLWPLWDERHQALHDKVAGTVVVRTR